MPLAVLDIPRGIEIFHFLQQFALELLLTHNLLVPAFIDTVKIHGEQQ